MYRELLARGVTEGHTSRAYAREELRAEMPSYLTGSRIGLGHDPAPNTRFTGEWAKALHENPREFYLAAHSAERMSRYVTARVPEMEPTRSTPSTGRGVGWTTDAPDPGAGRDRRYAERDDNASRVRRNFRRVYSTAINGKGSYRDLVGCNASDCNNLAIRAIRKPRSAVAK